MTAHLSRPDGRIAYTIQGSSGPVVLALPGIGDTVSSYRRFTPLLVAQGLRVIEMDLRGHGGADTTFTSHTSEDIGDDVVALLDQLDLTDVTVVGNSIGAAAAVHAALASDRVGRIVSLSGFVGDPKGFVLMRLMLLVMFVWPWGVAAWKGYRPSLFVSRPADFDANEAALMTNLRESGRIRAIRQMMTASKAGIEARLGEVKVPALVAMGASDPDFTDPKAEAERQAAALGGNNRVVMIDGAGHYPQIEQPEATAQAIADFVGVEVPVGA